MKMVTVFRETTLYFNLHVNDEIPMMTTSAQGT